MNRQGIFMNFKESSSPNFAFFKLKCSFHPGLGHWHNIIPDYPSQTGILC
jgi:hypothetical protein